jgi:hypothetical protein
VNIERYAWMARYRDPAGFGFADTQDIPCMARCTAYPCKHDKTKAGHCNMLVCSNHWSTCPVHSGS